MKSFSLMCVWALLVSAVTLAACDQFNMPRLTREQPKYPRMPLALTVVLDDQLQRATLEQPACADSIWVGPVGEALQTSLKTTGQTRVNRLDIVQANLSQPNAIPASSSDYIVLLTLTGKEFTAVTRGGDSDQYEARIALNLLATYLDGSGRTLGAGPLTYSDNVRIFTPSVSSGGTVCMTGELDTTLAKAADGLTDQLFSTVARFPRQGPPTVTASQEPPGTPPSQKLAPAAAAAGTATIGHARIVPSASPPITSANAGTSTSSSTAASTRSPNQYAVVIGVQRYRDPWPTHAPAQDITGIVNVLRDQAGVPLNHIMVLEDELANRLDIEETLTQWLASRVNPQSIVYVYFLGQAVLAPQTGDVYLAPYDATRRDPLTRFVSLSRFQNHLARANAKLTLTFIDAPLTKLAMASSGKNRKETPPDVPANWRGTLGSHSDSAGLVLQFARNGSADEAPRPLLAGLSGSADLDQDGQVTAGELLKSLKGITATAPLVSASSPALGIVLSSQR
ncbi:hypothetical protein YTPLAS18_34380 [Nitrospira sp.]|nr:hypothetical protein YTPLAS18_34380 [Nitrospira sp.]